MAECSESVLLCLWEHCYCSAAWLNAPSPTLLCWSREGTALAPLLGLAGVELSAEYCCFVMANSYQEQRKARAELDINTAPLLILDIHKAVFLLCAVLSSACRLGSPWTSAGLLLQFWD